MIASIHEGGLYPAGRMEVLRLSRLRSNNPGLRVLIVAATICGACGAAAADIEPSVCTPTGAGAFGMLPVEHQPPPRQPAVLRTKRTLTGTAGLPST